LFTLQNYIETTDDKTKKPMSSRLPVLTFPQILKLEIENFSSENPTFPQNRGKLFRGTSSN
jgi:hypothetical protein